MARSTFTNGVLVAMAASALLAVGCSLVVSFDESQIPQDTDGGLDADIDSAIDTGSIDSGEIDSGSTDSGEMDSTATDSGADTTPPGDTGATDSTSDAPADSGSDSTAVDSGTDSVIDSGTDTGTDTATDSGADTEMDMGVMDMGTDTSASTTPSTFAGCTSADYAAHDFTGDGGTTAVEITFPGSGTFAYTPKCIRVKAGQTVTWSADSGSSFGGHPLRHAPTNVDSTKIPDQDTGTTFSETFSVAGFYGYYCNFHGSPSGTGMSGTIEVVP